MTNMNNLGSAPMFNWNAPTAMQQPNQPVQPPQQNPQYPMNLQNIEQTQQTRSQIFYIPGRGVNSSDEVQAYEVLMNSPMNIFPKNDRKEIYVKYWGANGTIETDTYRLVEKNPSGTDDQNDDRTLMPAGLIDMQKQLNRIEKMLRYNSKKRYNEKSQKKESE